MVRSWDPVLVQRGLRPARPPGTVPLFCLPSAGNGDLQFDRWPDAIGRWRTCPLWLLDEVPGDGLDSHSGIPDRAADLVSALTDVLVDRFALFGHESAALLVYEMAVELDRRGMTPPSRLFVSGSPAPQHAHPDCVSDDEDTDDELTEKVLAAVVATHGNPLPAVVAAGVRALRADLAALHEYKVSAPVRLHSPITAVDWTEQAVDATALAGWTECGDAELVRLLGARLRYATHPADLVRVIRSHQATGRR
jgi:medium-chain acyl-[acyl-carrier-protein] hydrolase